MVSSPWSSQDRARVTGTIAIAATAMLALVGTIAGIVVGTIDLGHEQIKRLWLPMALTLRIGDTLPRNLTGLHDDS